MDRKFMSCITYLYEVDEHNMSDDLGDGYIDSVSYHETEKGAMDSYNNSRKSTNFYCGAVGKVIHDSEN